MVIASSQATKPEDTVCDVNAAPTSATVPASVPADEDAGNNSSMDSDSERQLLLHR